MPLKHIGLPPSSLEELKSISNDYDYVLGINNWLVRIKKGAYVFEREFIKKYGKNRMPLAEAWIEDFNYSISSPILTADELIELIRSMRPMTRNT
ncbi:hypothetical protein KEJ27_02780 [Candidatus Bathyarchaeota archaeon]|nr:hypothetical protein [Candidatus Bathyarchaeota archaeon]MBS7612646.1 hypothetical protein [Candidatus Bathyarchaeota archaeon]MBS7617229.1 hypothetical protein [Candidatus Bathyarchaeota archaeon]